MTHHALIVIDHPNPGSLTHALAARFALGAAQAGHTHEVADLHAEGFDPRWRRDDMTSPPPQDVLVEQARIDRATVICLAYPLFWFGMPAMMKGWMDRVWTYGWAYDQVDDPHRSLQPDRIGVALIPAAGNPEGWAPHGFEGAMRTQLQTGMMGYFGMHDQRVHLLAGSEGSDARRAGLLQEAEDAGRTL
ncbi:MAG: NAD(P)H-dependent oxidoreductase [Pseudomonadota bacterium]